MTSTSEAGVGAVLASSQASDRDERADEVAESDRGPLVWAFVAGAVGVAALVLWREAETEPFHVDELRQVRPYGQDFDRLVDASFLQDQPPLDVLVGSRFQQVFGVGDVLQRGHSMLAGLLVLVCLAVLMWRHRVRFGVPVALLVLSLSPVFFNSTAYARPYALPLALMIAYLLSVDVWLDRGGWLSATAVIAVALALPLSRVVEPPVLLVLVSATVVIAGRRCTTWGRRVWLPVVASVASLIVVEVPVYRRLASQLGAYGSDGSASLGDHWRRIVEETVPRLGQVAVNGWIAGALVVVALAASPVRRRLTSMWWFWPLAVTPIMFVVLFHVRTQPEQSFQVRYGYFLLPPFAVVIGLLAEHVRSLLGDRPTTLMASVKRTGMVALLCGYGATLLVAATDEIRTTDRPDYRRLGNEIEARLPIDTTVVYDATDAPLGGYRPSYAGYGRYTSPERTIYGTGQLLREPELIAGVDEFALATNGDPVAIDGWRAVEASDTMTLYVPIGPRSGARDLAADLVLLGEAYGLEDGLALRLAGAASLAYVGDLDSACAIIDRAASADPSVAQAIESELTSAGAIELSRGCAR